MLDPYPHQVEAIRLGTNRNILVADECGLGKTLVGIEIARNIQAAHPAPVLIIGTKGAKLQWAYNIADQTNADIKVLHAPAEFSDVHDLRDTQDPTWFIMHYAAFRKITQKDAIAKTYFSTIVLDEAHRIKNRRTQQTRGIKKLLSLRKVGLTATEMEKAPDDMWSILNWLYPNRFTGYWGFRAKFTEIEKHPYFGYEKVIGAKNVEQLAKLLEGIYLKRTKMDVRDDLPPLTVQRVPVELNSKVLRYDHEFKTAGDVLVDIEGNEFVVANALARIAKRRQLTSNGLGLVPTTDKIEWVKDYVEDNPNTNILIFTVFRATARRLAADLACPLVIGDEQRPDVAGTKPNLLVGTVKAMGESYDMPWMDVAIFVDCEWSTTLMEQARDRIHRINITSPKLALYLYHPGTVDDLVFEALDNKWDTIQVVQEYLMRYA